MMSAVLLADLAAVAALAALLAVAVAHPRARVEVAVSVLAGTVAIGSGLVDVAHARATLAELAPVVVFLAAILIVADLCDRAGVFAALGGLLRGGGARRLLTTAFAAAAVVTAVLSLDATVVLLTPIVVAVARSAGLSARPSAYACLRLANSASLLLPVSNLTNLLALPSLSLTFTGFAALTAPVVLAVLVVEYAGLSLLFRRELRGAPAHAHARPATPAPASTPAPTPAPEPTPLPVVPTVVVGLMLAGFAATSPLGLDPAWVALAAALVLAGWAGRRRLARPVDLARAAHAEFALLVLALGLVVAAVSQGFLGDAVASVVPDGTGFAALLGIAMLATALAAVLTNLSAALLLVPLVAPLGDVAVLAALIGLNVGAGLTWSGSLATLLWRRTMTGLGEPTGSPEFHRVSLLLTPVTLLVAVATLRLVG